MLLDALTYRRNKGRIVKRAASCPFSGIRAHDFSQFTAF
jgi:hypothetical protein